MAHTKNAVPGATGSGVSETVLASTRDNSEHTPRTPDIQDARTERPDHLGTISDRVIHRIAAQCLISADHAAVVAALILAGGSQ